MKIPELLLLAFTMHREYFCKDNEDIYATVTPQVGVYSFTISKLLAPLTTLTIQLDASGAITLINKVEIITIEKDTINNIFKYMILKEVKYLDLKVEGRKAPHHAPYIISIKINDIEQCYEPHRTYLSYFNYNGVTKFYDAPDQLCGRRKLNRKYTELIVGGSPSKYGDWPWHAAIYRYNKDSLKYICGGTLITKVLILTAAHCVTIRGETVNADILGVVLGKYTLHANDIAVQTKEVFKVIVNGEYNHRSHANDIAMLKLRTEVTFNNFVQPACLWLDAVYDQIGTHELTGTVVGWGFDGNDELTSELHEGLMPIVDEATCIRKEPVFYSAMLDGKKFCAGYSNGTTACNGDSGGGFLVFVNDEKLDKPISYPADYDKISGAWYIKGVVSTALSRKDAAICDPKAYAVFTDISKYIDWIKTHMTLDYNP